MAELLTAKQVAKRCEVAESTVRSAVKRGQLARAGVSDGLSYFDPAEVERWQSWRRRPGKWWAAAATRVVKIEKWAHLPRLSEALLPLPAAARLVKRRAEYVRLAVAAGELEAVEACNATGCRVRAVEREAILAWAAEADAACGRDGLTVTQVCELVGCSTKTVYLALRQGKFSERFGLDRRRIRVRVFDRDEVLAWDAARKAGPVPQRVVERRVTPVIEVKPFVASRVEAKGCAPCRYFDREQGCLFGYFEMYWAQRPWVRQRRIPGWFAADCLDFERREVAS